MRGELDKVALDRYLTQTPEEYFGYDEDEFEEWLKEEGVKQMYYIKKKFEVAGSHKLNLDYDSPCQNFHGHNFKITVFCKNDTLNKNGMVIDFKQIKEIVHDTMDHKCLNDVFDFNPTAENIAKWIVKAVPYCYKAIVEESENNEAIYEIQD